MTGTTSAIPMAEESELGRLFDMDEAKEKDGVAIQYGTLAVKIARMGGANKTFQTMFEEKSRPFRRMIENGVDLPEEIAQDIMHECYARCIVRDWNLARNKVAVPCTPENIIEQFKKRPEFFKFVVQESQRSSNYRLRAVADESKNS